MEGQDQTAKALHRSHPIVPVQQDFLFVDASEAKASRQGRRNARSFVMQKARRERPWSTSKQAAKQRAQGSASPRSAGTPNPLSTPNTASSSPTLDSGQNSYFPAFEHTSTGVLDRSICSNCQIFVVRHRQTLCPKCILLSPAGSVREPNNGTLDPFGASALTLDKEMSELLDHCKSTCRNYQSVCKEHGRCATNPAVYHSRAELGQAQARTQQHSYLIS